MAIFGLLFALTWVKAPWPAEQSLHHSLTLIGLLAMAWVQRRYPLPATSFGLILVFLALHTVAARWLYSYVPYDQWSQTLFGFRLSDRFGWRRNHFDRLVHLSYGLCFAPVLARYFRDARRWTPGWAAIVAVEIILSTSMLYELFEWFIAMTLSPQDAEAYNGQQGDMWDAHKDMSMAAIGALVAASIDWLKCQRR